MSPYLLDADVIIWFLRGDENTIELVSKLQAGNIPAVSAVTIFQVKAGMRPKEKRPTEEFLDSMQSYDVTPRIASKAAEYFRAFRAHGLTLEIADLIMAATASVHGLALATYNKSHFPMTDIRLYPTSPPTPRSRPPQKPPS
jgi:predicted nucleic acid-binding protein